MLVAGKPLADEQSAEFLLKEYTGFKVQILSSFKRAVIPVQDLKAYVSIRKIIKDFQPHIVHTHGSKPGVLGRIAAHQLNTGLIFHTYHGHVFHSYFNSFLSKIIVALERKLATYTTAIIAINEQLRKDLSEVYHIAPAEKIEINRLGIECEKLQDADGVERKTFRSEFNLDANVIAIGIIGRLVPIKNHSAFIELAALLFQHYKGPLQLKFFIIGDGEEKQHVIHTIKQKGLTFTEAGSTINSNAQIVFTSWRKDIKRVMAGLDIITLTSLNEGTPVSILEAMAAGRPVVAKNAGGINELFVNPRTGFVCNSIEEMSNVIQDLLNAGTIMHEVGKNAASFAKSNLTIAKQVKDLTVLYSKGLKNLNS